MKKLFVWVMAAFLVVGLAFSAWAAYPTRPITVIVQFGAGGATDQVNRALAAEMQRFIGVPINVINMPGATGAVATAYVMGQPHDGYVWLGLSDNIRMYQVMDLGGFSYKDFHMWIAAAGVATICVRPDSPIKTMDDFLKAMKEMGKDLTLANSGIANGWHIALEMLKKEGGGDFKIVVYPSGRAAVAAAVAGETKAGIPGLMEAIDLIKGGQLKVLATFNDEPIEIEGVGRVPTVAQWAPNIKKYLPFGGWWGIAVPKDVPEEVVKAIDAAYAKAVQSPKFKYFINKQAMVWLGYDRKKSEEYAARETSLVSWLLWELKLAKKSPESFNIPKP